MEKEELLSKKKSELKKLGESINIDEKKFDKKLLFLTEINKEEYEKEINQLVNLILDYNYFIKDANQVQNFLIKYRDSLIIAYYFKIIEKKIYKIRSYVAQKHIIFLNNEKLFKMLNKLYLKHVKKITDEIYDYILEKISKKDLLMIHKKECEQKIKLYKEICYLYPILNFFENIHDKYIFDLKEDLTLDFSECIFY